MLAVKLNLMLITSVEFKNLILITSVEFKIELKNIIDLTSINFKKIVYCEMK